MRRFDQLQPELEKHGIRVIALSKDTVEEAATHKSRDGLTLTLLSDANLDVIKKYGVEHHKAFGFATGSFSIGGVPLSFVPSYKSMALPTTLLIDEHGVIQWIDQTDDYRLRSDDGRIREAVAKAFD